MFSIFKTNKCFTNECFTKEQFDRLVERIKGWEGYSPTAYKDPPTQDKYYSWGNGTKAPKKAIKNDKIIITEEEAEIELMIYLKKNTLKEYAKIENKYPFFINAVRREALCDMLYNLGYTRFRKFKKVLKMLYDNVDDDWHFIAAEALDSDWYKKDCPKRAAMIAYELDTGIYYENNQNL